MMRLPRFRYLAPRAVKEAAEVLADLGPDAAPLAGGTDLLPSMKRRQQTPGAVVGLRGIAELQARSGSPATGVTLGAMTRLSSLERDRALAATYPALTRAAALVASPAIRNTATLGGNLCLDTRCTYYDQSETWRESIGHCMKRSGATCWVAPGADRCYAVSSSDTAPVLCALGAEVSLVSKAGERRIPAPELFDDDGACPLTRRADEVLTAVHLPPVEEGQRATYLKVRRRGAVDFPILGVAARVRIGRGGVIEAARIFLGAVGSRPQEAAAAEEFLVGRSLGDEEVLREAGRLAAQVAKPMQNADLTLGWRKQAAREYATRALRDLSRSGGACPSGESGRDRSSRA